MYHLQTFPTHLPILQKVHHHNTRFSAAGNFYIKHSRTGHMKSSFSRCKNMECIVFPTVTVLYLYIYPTESATGYFDTEGYLCWRAYLIDIFSKY